MAPRSRKVSTGKDAKKKTKSTESVAKYMLFAKHALAPYPNEQGNPLYSGDVDHEEFLEPKAIVKSRNPTNCEYLRRPGMAVSLAAAALRVGGPEAVKDKIDGHQSVAKFLKEKADFVKCLKVLDIGKTRKPDKKQIEKAMGTFVDTFQSLGDKERKARTSLAVSSARLYLLAMNALETADLLANPKIYARKVEKAPGQLKLDAASWMKHPGEANKLKAMLVRSLQQKIKKQKKDERGDGSKPDTSDPPKGKDKKKRKSSSSRGRKSKDVKSDKKSKRDRKDRRHKKRKASSNSRKSAGEEAAFVAKEKKRGKKDKKQESSGSSSGSKKRARRELAVGLSPESDPSPSAARTQESAAFKSWAVEEIRTMMREVDEGLRNYQNKTKRLSLDALVALLDNLSPEILELAKMTATLGHLKTMQKLPRQAAVKEILEKIQGVARRALEVHEQPPMETKALLMTVHRIGGVAADGRAVVREGDPADELEIEDENETVAEAVARLMTAQGSEADLPNWTVKAMDEDKVIREISPDTTPASSCLHVVLLRKGG
ncbi:unnamed protein product [Symbiodinium sp. CCMP2456]|nr:unnamed protein product [Symbiodinium sp. CCMP2456]